jgi:hypothetical protein
MTRAAAAAYVARDGLSDDDDAPGDIPLRSSPKAAAAEAPKKKVSIPAAFLGGGGGGKST